MVLLGRVPAAVAALGLLCGACTGSTGPSSSSTAVIGLGDPEPAPSVAPLEIVLESCSLNRPSVAPGTHEVALVGTGTVTFTDSSGVVVATFTGAGDIVTEREVYTITCTSSAATARATLTSTP